MRPILLHWRSGCRVRGETPVHCRTSMDALLEKCRDTLSKHSSLDGHTEHQTGTASTRENTPRVSVMRANANPDTANSSFLCDSTRALLGKLKASARGTSSKQRWRTSCPMHGRGNRAPLLDIALGAVQHSLHVQVQQAALEEGVIKLVPDGRLYMQ